VYILGIALTRASDISTDLVSSNQITDYSFITRPFTLALDNSFIRCVSGLGPSGAGGNTDLGGWYFNGTQVFLGTNCGSNVFEMRAANGKRFPGIINLYLCRILTLNAEGVYSCIMMNSSMMEQTMRVGVYFSGRSESLDMYPITSLLTNFYLSTQLLQ